MIRPTPWGGPASDEAHAVVLARRAASDDGWAPDGSVGFRVVEAAGFLPVAHEWVEDASQLRSPATTRCVVSNQSSIRCWTSRITEGGASSAATTQSAVVGCRDSARVALSVRPWPERPTHELVSRRSGDRSCGEDQRAWRGTTTSRPDQERYSGTSSPRRSRTRGREGCGCAAERSESRPKPNSS